MFKVVVDCGSNGQIFYGKLREYYLVPGMIKVNLLKSIYLQINPSVKFSISSNWFIYTKSI